MVLGNYLKNSLRYDYKIPYLWAATIAVGLPALLFLVGLREFILVIGVVGAFVGVVEGTLVLLIFQKAKKKGDRRPEYNIRFPKMLVMPLIVLFAVGAIIAIFIL